MPARAVNPHYGGLPGGAANHRTQPLYHAPNGRRPQNKPPRPLPRQGVHAAARGSPAGRRRGVAAARGGSLAHPAAAAPGRRGRRTIPRLMHPVRRLRHGLPSTSDSMGAAGGGRATRGHSLHRSHPPSVRHVHRHALHHGLRAGRAAAGTSTHDGHSTHRHRQLPAVAGTAVPPLHRSVPGRGGHRSRRHGPPHHQPHGLHRLRRVCAGLPRPAERRPPPAALEPSFLARITGFN